MGDGDHKIKKNNAMNIFKVAVCLGGGELYQQRDREKEDGQTGRPQPKLSCLSSRFLDMKVKPENKEKVKAQKRTDSNSEPHGRTL